MHRSLSHSHSQSKKSQIFSTKYMLVIFSMCHMQNLGSFLEYWYHLFENMKTLSMQQHLL